MPPLLVTLALAAVGCWFGLISGEIDARSLASQIFFFSNYYNLYGPAHEGLGGTGVLWSLAVEEHFYLLFPLLFILLFRGSIGIRHIVALMVLVLAWRCARIALWAADEWTIYFSSDTRIDSILFGCLLALLEWRGFRFPQGLAAWLILAAAALLLLPTFVVSSDFFRSTFRYSLQGLALMPFFFYAVHSPSALPFRALNWPFVRRIGVYSYSIYLSHDVFIDALGRQGASTSSVLIVGGALSVAYAALLHELVEKPLRGMRSRSIGHPLQVGAASPPATVERAPDDSLQAARGAGTQPAFGRGRTP